MNRLINLIALGLFLSVLSCDLLRDGPFEVAGWSPGEGFHDVVPAGVSLWFTLEPDRLSVERSFSLAEDGTAVSGSFVWNDLQMLFIPASPLEKNRDYLISLGTEAQDIRGLSLERRFEALFTTRPESLRPVLLESFPPDLGILEDERETITLRFSQAMDRASFAGFLFSPLVQGTWLSENSGYDAVFIPQDPWTNGRDYRLTAGTEIKSEAGHALGKPVVLHFSAGLDNEPPRLGAVHVLDSRLERIRTLDPETENPFWERSYALEFVFSEPVDSASVVSALSSEPSMGLVLCSFPGYGVSHVFRFGSDPVWGTSFTLKLDNTVKDKPGNVLAESFRYRIKADGPASKPPSLAGIRLPLDPGGENTAVYRVGDLFEDLPVENSAFPFDTEKNFWIELYFDTAGESPESAEINTFSLMEKFRFSATNNALSFSPREAAVSGFTIPQAVPGWEKFSRAEIRGLLTNRPYGGMVTIETGQALADSFGNLSAETFRILLLK
ncbi:MAG: Ig-like domain-containing protein [Treponema sp.]|jgi:hypothetical protein|nr:Ig-like domain-containing protein [Treponema sp.]